MSEPSLGTRRRISTAAASKTGGSRSADEDVVEVRKLAVSFATDEGPVRAVDGVSFDIHQRECLAVVGESGSGKSVTARAILGMVAENATVGGTVILRNRAT